MLADAAIYWISTVRADGRPHVTPVIAVWRDWALHVSTGPEEQKHRNLMSNPNVVVTTGTNEWTGLDVVVEGTAARVSDDGALRDLAAAWEKKYGEKWHFDVADGAFRHDAGEAHCSPYSATAPTCCSPAPSGNGCAAICAPAAGCRG